MTEPSYRGPPSLDDYFRDAIREGMSPDKAALSLESRIRKKLLATEPELVWPFDLIPTGDGHLYVKMTNGEGPARNFQISIERDRGMTTIFGTNPPTALERAAIDSMYPDLVTKVPEPEVPTPTPEPVTAPEPSPTPAKLSRQAQAEALQQLVARAAAWTAPQLREDSKVDDFRDACLTKFPGLSSSAYTKKVLPMARLSRGWPAQANPGPKPARKQPAKS